MLLVNLDIIFVPHITMFLNSASAFRMFSSEFRTFENQFRIPLPRFKKGSSAQSWYVNSSTNETKLSTIKWSNHIIYHISHRLAYKYWLDISGRVTNKLNKQCSSSPFFYKFQEQFVSFQVDILLPMTYSCINKRDFVFIDVSNGSNKAFVPTTTSGFK